jgi:succinate-acetate transporter protein
MSTAFRTALRGRCRTDQEEIAMATQTYARHDTATAPVVREFADPAPLGLAAFALTTFVLSMVNTRIIPADTEAVVFSLAFAYGGIAQFAAGLWEFAKGNTFGATAFCSFGAFWLSYWWLVEHDAAKIGDADKALGTYLLAWGIFTLYMAVAASRVSGAVLAVFVFLTITFFLLAIGDFASSEGWTKVGGWAGLLTAVAAWYASFAGVANFTFGRTVLPTAPR